MVIDEEGQWIYCKNTYETNVYDLADKTYKCLTRIDAKTGTEYFGTVFWTRIEDNNPLTGMPVRNVPGIEWHKAAVLPLRDNTK